MIPMQIEIFDVGHGHCTVITAPNGRRMMLDCGQRWDDRTFWTPSLHYFNQTIDLLALLNLDEDHVRDFDSVMRNCTVPWVLSNPTIGPSEIAVLKKDGMGSGARAVAGWLARPKGTAQGAEPDFMPVQIRWYYGFYVPGAPNTTNDLSLMVVAQFGAFKIVFAGDLEVAGWRRLLSLPSFRQDLICTSVFVASHHGRESGYCTELFDLFRPQLVIISDDERQFDSQDTDDWYRDRCAGAIFAQNPNMRRYVATTRKDGSMRIDVDAAGRWWIRRVLVRDWPRNPIPASPRRSGLGALASLGFGHNPLAPGANVLLSAFSTPPVPPKPEPSLGALLSIDNDPLARALGLGSLLAPTPVKR
jgi:beta-lactamase superfamily II metal-dependent hydrolase